MGVEQAHQAEVAHEQPVRAQQRVQPGALVAFAAAVASFTLIRQRDYVARAPVEAAAPA